MRYVDPTGEAIAVIPFIAPTVIAGAKAIGAWLAGLFVVGAAATAVGVTLDAAIDGSKSESPSDSSTVPSPLIDSGVSSAEAMPPSPDDDEDSLVQDNASEGKYREKTKYANKNDRKQIENIARENGIDRREFGDFVEETKRDSGRSPSDNYSYKELQDLAQEFKELY